MASSIALFRAVTPAEAEAIRALQRFSLLPGLETKYFATTLSGAQSYARRAAQAFGDGPFTIIQTSIDPALITAQMIVKVDGEIETVVIPAEWLHNLSPPDILSSGRWDADES